MIFRVLIKHTEKPYTIHDFKEHKLLTIRMLIIVKDQLVSIDRNILCSFQTVLTDNGEKDEIIQNYFCIAVNNSFKVFGIATITFVLALSKTITGVDKTK